MKITPLFTNHGNNYKMDNPSYNFIESLTYSLTYPFYQYVGQVPW